MITIRASSTIFKNKNQNVTKTIFGFTLETKDIVIKRLSWLKNLNIDENYLVPMRDS